MNEFTFGRCSYCDKPRALKNNVCSECNKKVEIPDFLKVLFNKDKED